MKTQGCVSRFQPLALRLCLHLEGFQLSPLRNSTKNTNPILYIKGGTKLRHKAYAQSNHLYVKGKAQSQSTK